MGITRVSPENADGWASPPGFGFSGSVEDWVMLMLGLGTMLGEPLPYVIVARVLDLLVMVC